MNQKQDLDALIQNRASQSHQRNSPEAHCLAYDTERFFPCEIKGPSPGPAGREKGLSAEQGRQTEREEEEEKGEEAEAGEKAVPEEESPTTAAFKPPPSLGNKETQRGETVYDV